MRVYGVGPRLSLALAAVVAIALLIAYLVVVPSLENRVVDAKLAQLERAAGELAPTLPADPFRWPDFVEVASVRANARVAILDVLRHDPPALTVAQDSHGVSSTDLEGDAIAARAALRVGVETGTVERGDTRFAEVAVPLRLRGPVLLLSGSLQDALADVRLVERRLLLAGGIALAFAAILGYGGAILFARRIRRLERAADRIARGEFGEPVVDRGADEVGELASAFDRMREQLERLDHARREFIANASHELRTPLFSLAGFLELLADEELDDATRREFVDTARVQVERLTKLATELLDLSRLDAGRLRLEREHVDLAAVARAAAEELAARTLAEGRSLTVDAPAAVAVVADEERVLQIVRALLDNALAHTAADVPVLVRALRRSSQAVLEVEDEGPGIEPAHAPHVFERFYRADGAIASGSGLGLAIARELATLMGGRLDVVSRPGRTVFALTLTAVAEPAPELTTA